MPKVTLFMLSSIDGKISTGDSDLRDFDLDLPLIDGVKEGLHQYYDEEKKTDTWALNSGRTFAKIGFNDFPKKNKVDVNMVVLDNTHLTRMGVLNLLSSFSKVFIITSNHRHPAHSIYDDNLVTLYQQIVDLELMLKILEYDYGCKAITVQTGETLNGFFLRHNMFDYVTLIVAPIFIGGKTTPALAGSYSFGENLDLNKLCVLQLEECTVLEHSYLKLRYKCIKKGEENGTE